MLKFLNIYLLNFVFFFNKKSLSVLDYIMTFIDLSGSKKTRGHVSGNFFFSNLDKGKDKKMIF